MEQVGEMDCTNSEAAKLIGIDYNIYKKIMEFGKIPKPVILMRIADHFQLSVDYLLGRSKIPHFEPASPRSSFSERYARLKREYNMTDYAVAQKLHISTSYTSAWKKYGFVPSLNNLTGLCETFHVSFDFLLGRTDDRNPIA